MRCNGIRSRDHARRDHARTADRLLLFLAVAIGTMAAVPVAGQTLTLRDAIGIAMEGNPSLRAVLEQHDAAEARVRETRSGHLPMLSAGASYTWHQEPNIVFPIHRAGVFPPLDDRIFESNVQAVLPLFSGGKVLRRTDAARAAASQQQLRGEAARQELLRQLVLLYLGAAEIENRRTLITSRLADLRVRRTEAAALASEGRMSAPQFALLDAQLHALRADSMHVVQGREELAWRLAQLTGSETPVYPDIAGVHPSAIAVPDAATPTVGENVDWRIAQAALRQAEAEASAAGRAFFPDISAFAMYNYRSGGTAWDPAGEWAAGVRLSLPLFDGGRSIAAVSATQAQRRAAEEQAHAMELRVRTELEISAAARRMAAERLRATEEAVREKGRFVTAQQELHRAGRLALSELLTQETELLQLSLQAASLTVAAAEAELDFHRAAGSLTTEIALAITGDHTP
ncbi:MAG: TolC family protein [Bacteroidota bacterium]|nr:TolC family protein [Bacteroidota bacterium]